MKTLLIPVDFSAPSDNAIAFAADLANASQYEDLVLVANVYVPIFEQIIPSPDLLQVTAADVQQKKRLIREHLEALKAHIQTRLSPNTSIKYAISDLPLVRAVLQQVHDVSPALVVIGSNSYHNAEDSMIGRQIVRLAKVIPAPVLVVPPQSNYRPVTDVLVAAGWSSLAAFDPKKMLEKLNPGWHPTISLLDIDASHQDLPGVLQFAEEKQVQLIIALPGRHSFLYHLTHQNIQQGILQNARKPVLILK